MNGSSDNHKDNEEIFDFFASVIKMETIHERLTLSPLSKDMLTRISEDG